MTKVLDEDAWKMDSDSFLTAFHFMTRYPTNSSNQASLKSAKSQDVLKACILIKGGHFLLSILLEAEINVIVGLDLISLIYSLEMKREVCYLYLLFL
jgi:hypothetical protein